MNPQEKELVQTEIKTLVRVDEYTDRFMKRKHMGLKFKLL